MTGPLQASQDRNDPPRFKFSRRLIAAMVLLPTLGLLLTAAYLEPDPKGAGTHRQLGLEPCTFLAITGYPCPSCGMTTAFSWMAKGRPIKAFQTQPMGALLALLTAMTMLAAGWALMSNVNPLIWCRGIWQPGIVLLLVAFALLAWCYKIAVMRQWL